jgi:hypothetical protein
VKEENSTYIKQLNEQQTGYSNYGTTENFIDKEPLEELDEQSAKLACGWLQEQGKEFSIVGETLAL